MKQLFSFWSFDITAAVSFTAIIIMFWLCCRSIKHLRTGYFIFAVVVMLLCFFSPLQHLSANYLFSAHMAVHVLLLLCAGPLLVLSLPSAFQHPIFNSFAKHPLLCWLAGVGIMWVWHVPAIFNYSMNAMHTSAGNFHFLHFLENVSLVVSGAIFSAPVVQPGRMRQLNAMQGVVYLFTACVGCSLLGLLITFAPPNTYHHFLAMHDAQGINAWIRKAGITQSIDQQAAGLIMWVPCCFIYVAGALYLMGKWFSEKEEPQFNLSN